MGGGARFYCDRGGGFKFGGWSGWINNASTFVLSRSAAIRRASRQLYGELRKDGEARQTVRGKEPIQTDPCSLMMMTTWWHRHLNIWFGSNDSETRGRDSMKFKKWSPMSNISEEVTNARFTAVWLNCANCHRTKRKEVSLWIHYHESWRKRRELDMDTKHGVSLT